MNYQNIDLAGYCPARPDYLHIRRRMNALVDRYLSIDILSRNLTDLPTQFSQPHTRKWESIDWQGITPSQIIGVDPNLFTMLIAGATEIESPIREYSHESWHYFQSLHPPMAYFMGGEYHQDGSIASLGVWEKEERQHAPAFSKIYQQLTGTKITAKPNSVNPQYSIDSPWADLEYHTNSRIATEWSAISVYLWLMAHSTGALQQAIAQPLQDEVNHLAKFWGFSRWAFDGGFIERLGSSTRHLTSLLGHHQQERTDGDRVFGRATPVNAIELAFSFSRVMVRMRSWNRELSPSFLCHLFGTPELTLAAG